LGESPDCSCTGRARLLPSRTDQWLTLQTRLGGSLALPALINPDIDPGEETGTVMSTATLNPAKPSGLSGVLKKLSEIQVGGGGSGIRKKDMVYIFRSLATLLENGLSLAKSLSTLREEKSLKRYRPLFEAMERSVTQGSTLSTALAAYPQIFNELMIHQIRVGERSGQLSETISRITVQLETSAGLKAALIKKLTYPALLSTAGAGSLTFMMLYVVPTFEKMYSESKAELPGITKFLIAAGAFLTQWSIPIAIAIGTLVTILILLWRHPTGRLWLDGLTLKVPVMESWLRNIAVLQFTDVLGNLMESGFTLAEALPHTSRGICNRVVRGSVEDLNRAIVRGERFSRELERRSHIFPPVVTQLVIVGEKTGTLPKATRHIREHLKREVERYTNLMVGAIEPVMTIGLAAAIGGILLAVYLPMFDMIGAMNH